ncbi:hypothetical protein CANCADRAFT_2331 [Tortispora caseinolytica NRRL Y-17796]|uniref:Small ribosomal subunit protein bS18m n=1 Tax=Tortispora caseinolytica NRRL Y-17796 TaxID=767744 RepID=A0A1E4TFR9_9ASCO|nr:hypothetical protein CANCADRAFT_2331 [Tortispora caseinolytica NRRL Y-17796]
MLGRASFFNLKLSGVSLARRAYVRSNREPDLKEGGEVDAEEDAWAKMSNIVQKMQDASKYEQDSHDMASAEAIVHKATRILPVLNTSFSRYGTYKPYDLSLHKALTATSTTERVDPSMDNFQYAGVDPLKFTKDPVFLSQFLRVDGSIKGGRENGLEPRTQRRLTKAIKRARAAGLLSHTHVATSLINTKVTLPHVLETRLPSHKKEGE